ncbi:hypothetical protein Tco_0761761 [Tanacetum coccineum]
MDSTISLGQKNTLAEYMILSGADNRPPILDKDLYDSWKSRMELYMQNREYGRMILESVENGPLIWPIVEENGVIKTNKYAELSAAEKIQADCDMKATNIILQGLPADIYSLSSMDLTLSGPCLDADFLVADSKFMKVAFGVGFKMLLFNPLIVTTSRYVVPTGRVKVPAGRYVVPTGKDKIIVSAGRTKVIPAGSTILVLRVLRKQVVRVSWVFKKPTALDEGTD